MKGEPDRQAPSAAVVSRAVPKVVLIGFMGAGKTRAAQRIAAQLGVEAEDSDALIEAELGEPIDSFFAREGEAAFREREEALVLELLERPGGVAALGGGALRSEHVRERLAEHVCVYIEIDPDLAWSRVHDSSRPLARDRERFERLYGERVPLYESVARVVIPSTADPMPEAPLAAAAAFAGRFTRRELPAGLKLIWARTAGGGYPVFSGPGAVDAAGMLWPVEGRCFVVADERVAELHGDRLTLALGRGPGAEGTIALRSGEQHKTLEEAGRILRALATAGVERSDSLLALGGGVAGDVAGFCAAIYQRGVGVVHVPTTLVAQVDSAYGGKTGVDLPEAKNYVGAFHQPAAVFTDPDLLATLPAQELRAGFAEVIKTALIAGGPLWREVGDLGPIERSLADDAASVRRVIEGCLRTKLALVARDERDAGPRASLNLGHTFAHALEAATGYSAYRHGEAVAIGLLAALRLSEREAGLDPAVRRQVRELLERHGLPSRFEGPSAEALLRHAARDKKRQARKHRVVLLNRPGEVLTGYEVGEQALREAFEEARAS